MNFISEIKEIFMKPDISLYTHKSSSPDSKLVSCNVNEYD